MSWRQGIHVQGVEGKYGEGLTLALIGSWVTRPMREYNLMISVPFEFARLFSPSKMAAKIGCFHGYTHQNLVG